MLAWKPPEYEKWSEARRAAWDALPMAADEYYSSYLPPGEKPLPNDWTAKELSNFAKLLNEHPEKVANSQWGLLSMHHPGRTGVQCKARYEKLLVEPAGGAAGCLDAQPTPITDRGVAAHAVSHAPVGAAAMSSPVPPLHYSPSDVGGGAGSLANRPSRLAMGSRPQSSSAAEAGARSSSNSSGEPAARSSASSFGKSSRGGGASMAPGGGRAMMPPPVSMSRQGSAGPPSASEAQSSSVSAASSSAALSARPRTGFSTGFTAHRAKFSRVQIRLRGEGTVRVGKGAGGARSVQHQPPRPVSRQSSLSSSSSATDTSSSEGGRPRPHPGGHPGGHPGRPAKRPKLGRRHPVDAERGRPGAFGDDDEGGEEGGQEGGQEGSDSEEEGGEGGGAAAAASREGMAMPMLPRRTASVPVATPGQRIPLPALPHPFVPSSPPPGADRPYGVGFGSEDEDEDSDGGGGGDGDDDDLDAGGRPGGRGGRPRGHGCSALRCVGPDGRVRSHDAIAAAGCALDALRGCREQLRLLLDQALGRELGPNLGGTSGLLYPTFDSLEALATAVSTGRRLATLTVQAHAAALSAMTRQAEGGRCGGSPARIREEEAPGHGLRDVGASVASAAAAAEAAEAAAAAAVEAGGHMTEATKRHVAVLLGVYEAVRADIERHETLQHETLQAMQRWEESGRPCGPGGCLPVFPLYTYTRGVPPVLLPPAHAFPAHASPAHASPAAASGHAASGHAASGHAASGHAASGHATPAR